MAAVKIVSKRKMKDHALRKEVRLMEMMKHDNIVRFYEMAEKDDSVFMYMELASGELFDYVITSGSLTEEAARPRFAEVAAAVQYMHSLGVVHRDLKLENVLLDASSKCKVCDFGLAHQFERQGDQIVVQQLHEVCGSRSYCAPEVLAGRGYEGYPTDVWSCGICLFAMLAGFFPLDEATGADWRFERIRMAVAQKMSVTHTIFGFYDRPCILSKPVTDLIDGMLTIDPSARLTVAQVLASPWTDGQLDAPDGGQTPVYRSAAAITAKDLAQMYAAEDAEHLATPPVYRGGPPLGPPPVLTKQVNIFCADIYETEA